jgi:hypothetical protein
MVALYGNLMMTAITVGLLWATLNIRKRATQKPAQPTSRPTLHTP